MVVLVVLSLMCLVGCAADSGADEGLSADQTASKAMATAVTAENPVDEKEVVFNDDATTAENLKELNQIISEQEKVTEAEITSVADDIINIGIDEIITIKIVANTEKPFATFGNAIAFDGSKIEIVSSALVAEEGAFSGLFAANLAYDPSISGQGQNRLLWEQNNEKGLKTILMGGASANNFVGEVALFAITIKGVAKGETTLNIQALPASFVNTDNQPAEFTEELKAITIVVAE